MKQFILIFLFSAFLTLNLSAQKSTTPSLPIDSITGRITYTAIVSVDSVSSKQQMYLRAREWFAKTYRSSKDVIQMEDSVSGKIIGKALMQVYNKGLGMLHNSGYINYTISVFVKNGRYKYEVTNFYHTGQYISGGNIPDYGSCDNMINTTDKMMGMSMQKTYNFYLSQLDDNIKLLLEDLKVFMEQPQTNIQSEDW